MLGWLGNKSIKSRLLIAFTLVAGATAIVSGWGAYAMRRVNASLTTVIADRVVPLQQIKTVSDAYAVSIVDATHKLRAHSRTWEQTSEGVAASRKTIKEQWTAYRATYLTPEEKLIGDSVETAMGPAETAVRELETIIASRDERRLVSFAETRLYPAIDPVTDLLGHLTDLQVRVANEEFASASATYKWSLGLFVVLTLGAISGALLLGSGIARQVSSGLSAVVGRMQELQSADLGQLERASAAMSAGDLAAQVSIAGATVQVETRDEVLALAQAVNGITRRLADVVQAFDASRETLRRMLRDIDAVASAAAQGRLDARANARTYDGAYSHLVGSVNGALDTVVQAFSDVSLRMGELSSATQSTAENTARAQGLTDEANGSMARGRQQLESLGTAMDAIRSSGRETRTIVSAIEDIALQTNLLALNASVEAARAGAHGRGFAVVASEVRRLASRVTEAVKESQAMIATSEGSVERGGEAVSSALVVFDEIAVQVEQLRDAMTGIAAAAEEQASGIETISQSIGELTGSTSSRRQMLRIRAA